MSIALLDADIICYKAAAVAQTEIDWGDGEPATTVSEDQAADAAFTLVKNWTKAAGAKKTLLVFSDRTAPKTSFRYHIYHDYKGQRKGDRPVLHDFVKAQLESEYRNMFLPGLEGDDTMGLLATGERGRLYTVVTIDKDMATIPCRLVNPDKDEKPYKVRVAQADYNRMFQTLTGDPVDNYKGAPQVGPASAAVALNTASARGGLLDFWWDRVVDCYERAYVKYPLKFFANGRDMSPMELAVMNAQCARILRHGDYDHEKKLVRLWFPEGKHEWISPF